jgi:hypothetical protein
MIGGSGYDWYYVDDVGDVIVELVEGGTRYRLFVGRFSAGGNA